MNVADLAILAAVAWSAWGGMRAGFVMGLYQLAVVVVTVIASVALQDPVGDALAPMLPADPQVSRLAVYVVILTGLGYVLGIAGGMLLAPLVRKLRATKLGGAADRVLGLVPGALRGVVYAGSIVFIARLVLPPGHEWRALLDASVLAPAVAAIFERVYPFQTPGL